MNSPSAADDFDFDDFLNSDIDESRIVAEDSDDDPQMEAIDPNAYDPMKNVDYTGDDEKDTKAEYSALLTEFTKKVRNEDDRKRLATDSEYWFAICFETREQKEHFLAALDLLRAGDKYLDGYAVAEAFGIDLPAANVPYNTGGRKDKKLAPLVIPG